VLDCRARNSCRTFPNGDTRSTIGRGQTRNAERYSDAMRKTKQPLVTETVPTPPGRAVGPALDAAEHRPLPDRLILSTLAQEFVMAQPQRPDRADSNCAPPSGTADTIILASDSNSVVAESAGYDNDGVHGGAGAVHQPSSRCKYHRGNYVPC